MKRFLFLVVSASFLLSSNVLVSSNIWAAQANTKDQCIILLSGAGLGEKALKDFSQTAKKLQASPEQQKLVTAVKKKGLFKAELNNEIISQHNTHYSDSLERGKPTNQKSSGRCWIFAGCNSIRTNLVTGGVVSKKFGFSQSHLYFFSMFEKSNIYLERFIKSGIDKQTIDDADAARFRDDIAVNNLGDGGYHFWFHYLVKKYGLVPSRLFPDTNVAKNTATLNTDLKNILARYGSKILETAKTTNDVNQLRAIKQEALQVIWNLLSHGFGQPLLPNEKFTYVVKGVEKTYTPLTFASNFAGFNPDDYVIVHFDPRHAFGKTYRVQNSFIGAPLDGEAPLNIRYLNLPIARMRQLTEKTIDTNEAVSFSADIKRDLHRKKRILHTDLYDRSQVYNTETLPPLSRKDAIFLHESDATHAMSFFAYDKPDNKKPTVKYGVENSWGYPSVWHMYTPWFNRYVYEIVVPKSALSPHERDLWENGTDTPLIWDRDDLATN